MSWNCESCFFCCCGLLCGHDLEGRPKAKVNSTPFWFSSPYLKPIIFFGVGSVAINQDLSLLDQISVWGGICHSLTRFLFGVGSATPQTDLSSGWDPSLVYYGICQGEISLYIHLIGSFLLQYVVNAAGL